MAWRERGGDDRRSHARYDIVGQLWGSLETIQTLSLRNLGRGGALVESPAPLSAAAPRRIRLRFQSHVSEVHVHVRHVTPISDPAGSNRYLIGLEFDRVPLSTEELIDELVGRNAPPPSSSETDL